MTVTEDSLTQPQYNSLNDLRLRKELLRKDLEADSKKLNSLWNSLFTKPDILSKSASTSKRISSLVSVSAGAIDGAIFAWKLYRKFKKKK